MATFTYLKIVFCKWSLWKRLAWCYRSNQNKISFAQIEEELRLKHSLSTYQLAIPLADISSTVCHFIVTTLLG